MAETPADPALFRLRAFEVDWIEPLRAQFGSPEHFLDMPFGGSGPQTVTTLTAVLLLEADSWISIGELVGYFSRGSSRPSTEGLVEPEILEVLKEVSFGSFVSGPLRLADIDASAFARALSQAIDDLTPERHEFLRLFYFSGSEWERRLADVRRVAHALTRRPGLSLPPEDVDAIAWSLDGAESHIGHGLRWLPADWRSDNLRVPDWEPLVAERREALREARAEILAATEWIAEDELTSAQLRLAEGFRREQGTEQGPPRFRDVDER